MFSRNSASSRAIPVEKTLRMVQEHPYIPTHWGQNQRGMQAEQEVDYITAQGCEHEWMRARDSAIKHAQELLNLGIHKQITNRLLEPFLWHTVIVTATEWSNFFHLRCHPMAHPEIRKVAELMRDALAASTPRELKYGEWHRPLSYDLETAKELAERMTVNGRQGDMQWMVDQFCKISVGRCARVSYLTHDGKRDTQKDIELHDELLKNGHMSPFEHVARPATAEDWKTALFPPLFADANRPGFSVNPVEQWHGNFRGWVQYRKTIPGEADILGGNL
jgi:thymidylate synthase ThyX